MLDDRYDEVVFVEVKTRSSDYAGDPTTAITPQKKYSLYKAAMAYLQQNRLVQNFRFDVVTVLPSSIEQYENITW